MYKFILTESMFREIFMKFGDLELRPRENFKF